MLTGTDGVQLIDSFAELADQKVIFLRLWARRDHRHRAALMLGADDCYKRQA